MSSMPFGMAYGQLWDEEWEVPALRPHARNLSRGRRKHTINRIYDIMSLLEFEGRLLHAAVITPRGDKIRVISLRRANRREERAYAKARQSP
jgi:uncharacterized DUF497 family protein